MITFRTGSQVHRLITLLSVAGEYPTQSLHLLGNERMYKDLLLRLSGPQTIRFPMTGTSIAPARVVSVSGKGKGKTIRLYRGALPILKWIGAEEYYMNTFRFHKFSGDDNHKERNHRVSEALAMFMGAGFEFREYRLPKLQNETLRRVHFNRPSFYTGRYPKQVGIGGMNKTMFTRIAGAVFAGDACYAVYNTRASVMKWCGNGECKAKIDLEEIVSINTEISFVDSAILFGSSDKVALETLRETERNQRLELRFDGIYKFIYFVPLNEIGMRQLALFTIPNWKECVLDLLFEPEQRSYGRGSFEYDACVDGFYVLSHLDGDIARLRRFKYAVEQTKVNCKVLCFKDQVAFVKEYLGDLVQVMELDRTLIESELNLERRDIFEED